MAVGDVEHEEVRALGAEFALEDRVCLEGHADQPARAQFPNPDALGGGRAVADRFADAELADEALVGEPGGRLRHPRADFVEAGEIRFHRQLHGGRLGGKGSRQLTGGGVPQGEGRSGFQRTCVNRFRVSGREHFQQPHRRVAERAPMAIRRGRIADVLLAGRELAGSALQEQARSIGASLDHFPHRAGEIGRNKVVVPSQRRGMAGVVDEGRAGAVGIIEDAGHDQPVVGCGVRMEAC